MPIYRVLEVAGNRSVARWGLLLFSFSPAAYVYSLAYSEPLFLLAAAGAIAMREVPSRWRTRTFLAFVAQFARVTGIALAVAMIPDLLARSRRRSTLGPMLAVILALGSWCGFIALLTGDPLGYLQGTPSWFQNGFTPDGQLSGLPSLITDFNSIKVLVILFPVVVVVGILRVFRDGHADLAIFAAVLVATSLLEPWRSMPRLAAVAFPAFGGLAALLPTWRSRVVLLTAFGVAEVGFAYGAVVGFITP